jgi:hypothetical protein
MRAKDQRKGKKFRDRTRRSKPRVLRTEALKKFHLPQALEGFFALFIRPA